MNKAEFFKTMADNQLTVNFDGLLTTVDESERLCGLIYHQQWQYSRVQDSTGAAVGPNQETADRILRYWNDRRFLRNERRAFIAASNPS